MNNIDGKTPSALMLLKFWEVIKSTSDFPFSIPIFWHIQPNISNLFFLQLQVPDKKQGPKTTWQYFKLIN